MKVSGRMATTSTKKNLGKWKNPKQMEISEYQFLLAFISFHLFDVSLVVCKDLDMIVVILVG